MFKINLTLLLLFSWINTSYSQKTDSTDVNTDKAYEIFDISKVPTFPGGEAGLMKFLAGNIVYPKKARKSGVEGTVLIAFIVEKDGSISNAKIIKDPGTGLGKEALRVVKSMPPWTPGEHENHPIRVKFTLPVRFSLE